MILSKLSLSYQVTIVPRIWIPRRFDIVEFILLIRAVISTRLKSMRYISGQNDRIRQSLIIVLVEATANIDMRQAYNIIPSNEVSIISSMLLYATVHEN